MSAGVAPSSTVVRESHVDGDLAGPLVGELERLGDQAVALLLDEALASRLADDVGHLLDREGRGDLVLGLDPEEADEGLRDPFHRLDDRAQGAGDEEERRHEHEGRALGAGDGEVLGDHLADDDVQVGHDEQRQREGHTAGPRVGQPPLGEDRLEEVVQGGLGERAESDRAHRDAELRGREHRPEALEREQARLRTLAPGVGERLERRAPHRHGRELRADEEGVAEEEEHRDDVDPGAAHDGSPDPPADGIRPVGPAAPFWAGSVSLTRWCPLPSCGSGLGVRHETEAVDPATLHADDVDAPARHPHDVADDGYATEARHDEAAHRSRRSTRRARLRRRRRAPRRGARARAPSTSRR